MLQVLDRVAPFASGNIDNKKQNPAARNVTQKFVPESNTAMRVFDETGNIGNCRAQITAELNDADNRMQSSERIRRHFRPRRRNLSEQSRFPGIRITDQPSVRDRAQFEQKMSLLAFFALGVLARRAVP